jgi:hypothetical protein
MSQLTSETTSLITELHAVKSEYVDKALDWYKKRASWPRILFRISGTLVIVASLSIPFLSAAAISGESTTAISGAKLFNVNVAAFVTALLTALNSFYSWHSTWQKYLTTQLLIEGFIVTWQMEMVLARANSDRQKADDLAFAATSKLVEQTKEVITGEAHKFFANIKWPDRKELNS